LAPEADVLADRRREQVRVLAGDGDRAPHVLLPVLAQVAARERDAAGLGVEEADEQVDDRRLAGAARAAQPDPPARLETEIRAVEHKRLAGGVAGADVLERDRERRRRQWYRRVGVCDCRLAIGQLEEPLTGRERLGELTCRERERLHRLERGEREQRE